jgi:hypothetical protein
MIVEARGELHPPQPKQDSEPQPNLEGLELIAFEEEPRDPSKTGPAPKRLVAVEVLGYSVGRGKKKRVVTPDDVYKLAAIGCNDKEIATWFDIEYSTLKYNFSDIIAKGREELKQTLRHAMIKNALNGNAAVQIFLAKNMLGMSDNGMESDDKKPLPWTENDE